MSKFTWVKSVFALSGLTRRWQIAAYVCVGLAVGVAVVVGRVGNATSYLSSDSETCMNCHVMSDAYASWQRGSHANVAKCVDCHIPHDNPVAKLAFKAADGMKHSYVFTAGTQGQVLKLSDGAKPVVQANCLRCHADTFAMIRLAGSQERHCWDCHHTMHGAVHGLSASPRALRPKLPPALP
ncbi:MAG: cytochrome c nitrite reductase small subunit [Phycisphaerae bacterium]|nr:cytochrome c nitrite reductase small subunit [Phycisphaerae bacterium]